MGADRSGRGPEVGGRLSDDAPPRRPAVYGRRRARRLRRGRRALLDRLLPALAVQLPGSGPLDPAALFSAPVVDCWLEIGFGGGEHLLTQAVERPDIGFIGGEPFVDGVARLLGGIAQREAVNIRLWPDDARPLIDSLADASLGRVTILFPDPWPKVRHHKRRIVNDQTLAGLARVLRDGGELRLATDHPGYARWMLAKALANPHLCWTAATAADWRHRPGDSIETRYEAKARLAGRRPMFLRFVRRPRKADKAQKT